MGSRIRTNQGGSVVSFIVVGVVLLAGLGGGLYYLSRSGAPIGSGEVFEEPVTEPVALPGGDPTTEVTEDNNSDDQAAPAESPAEAPAAPDTVEEKPNPATDEKPTTVTSPTEIAQTGPSKPAPAAMPQTGPAEDAASLIGAALLSFMGISYVRSRRVAAQRRQAAISSLT